VITIRWMAALFVPLLAGAAADDRTALERATLFFGTYTNGIVVRLDPPNRTVFNYLVSYELETDAVVRYPMKLQRIPVRQIAAVAQQDRCGDAGFAGVPKAVRALSADESAIVRFNYKPNSVEKTRNLFAGMIDTDVPDVQGTAPGPQLDTEKLIDVPANLRNLDLGAGTTLNFGRAELQISPTIRGNVA
jgi:hypothetical protein